MASLDSEQWGVLASPPATVVWWRGSRWRRLRHARRARRLRDLREDIDIERFLAALKKVRDEPRWPALPQRVPDGYQVVTGKNQQFYLRRYEPA